MGMKINLITKTLERYGSSQNSQKRSRKVVPAGFFSVYVGADRQRFVVKMTCLNHPLFKLLLEDAESEFGFGSVDGPVVLPCDVDLFYRVLAEMESGGGRDDDLMTSSPGCSIGCSPVRLKSSRSGSGSSSYSVLAAPSRMLKVN